MSLLPYHLTRLDATRGRPGESARALWQAQTTSRTLTPLLTPPRWRPRANDTLREGRRTWQAACARPVVVRQTTSRPLTALTRVGFPTESFRRPSTSNMGL